MRRSVVLLLFVLTISMPAATPKRSTPSSAAPSALPHPIAQVLRSMSNDGRRTVTFKATAVGTRFFFEEPAGVTVYRFEKGEYVKDQFIRGTTLPKAVKRFASLR